VSEHEAQYEFDGAEYAVYCLCGFYRIAERHDVAEREYFNHVDLAVNGEL
jgi:hypothetical protein